MRTLTYAALSFFCSFACWAQNPAVITSSEVFSPDMLGETWTFLNSLGDLTKIDVQPSPNPDCAILFITKSAARAYWSPGSAGAKIQFEICKDGDGGWYSSRSVMSGETDAGGNASPWRSTSNVALALGMPRAYQIIPPSVSERGPSALVSQFRNYN